jgi:hypothetical protein
VRPAFPLLLTPLMLGSPWILKWVRRRYLIARVGYVESYPMGLKQIGAGIGLAVLMGVALFGVVPRLSHPDRWLLAGTGLFGGALAAYCGRLPRFVIGGALMAAAGLKSLPARQKSIYIENVLVYIEIALAKNPRARECTLPLRLR